MQLDEILNTLRPNTTAHNFREMLQAKQDNINKNSFWKQKSRKVSDDMEQNFMFKRKNK